MRILPMRLFSLACCCLAAVSYAAEPKIDFGPVREEHLMIPMRDGKKLSAYVFFPPGAARSGQ